MIILNDNLNIQITYKLILLTEFECA